MFLLPGSKLPVVIGQLLTGLDVCARKEDKAALSLHLEHLGVHAGRTAVVLHHAKHSWNTSTSDVAVLLSQLI